MKILIIGSFFSTVLLLIISVTFSYKFPKERLLYCFKQFSIFFLIGQLLLSSRNILWDKFHAIDPYSFSILLGYSSFIVGYIFLYMGIKALLNLEAKWKNRYLIPIAVPIFGFLLNTFIYFDVTMRIIIFSIFCTIYGLSVSILFWKNAREKFEIFDKVSSILFFSGVVLFFIRTIRAVWIQNYVSSTDIMLFLIYIYLFVMTLWLSVILIRKNKEMHRNLAFCHDNDLIKSPT